MAKRVLVTGAAGQIGYALVFKIARGELLGCSTPVILHMLDIPACMEALEGIVLELEDLASPLLQGVVATADLKTAFTEIDVAIFVGAMPRKQGMERSDLLKANAGIFKEQGAALDNYASKDVKVLVVGNPANTNAAIAMTSAPSIPRENFTCLTRLDHNRARSLLARKAGVSVKDVQNVIVWGNHSNTQFPDVSHATVTGSSGKRGVKTVINDLQWLQTDFITTVQQRGAQVIAKRKLSSAASAAEAICNHVHDWVLGTPADQWVSMGVPSDGSYGIKEGVIFSYPVTTCNGKYKIVQGLHIDEFAKQKIDATAAELFEERDIAFQFLTNKL